MEKITKEEVKHENVYHHIYCDKCNKLLEDSLEYDDGYYDNSFKYEQSIRIDNTWYTIQCDLCEDCAKLVTRNLIKTLEDFGFEEEKY